MSLLLSGGMAVAGLGTSLYGQYKAGKERKAMSNKINQWQGENKAFYNKEALGDYTQRADAQNAIRVMREQLDRQTKRANNTAAITGGTVEQTAVAKDSANSALADATSNIAAAGQQHKDKVTEQYQNRKQQLNQMEYGNMEGNAQSGEALSQTGLNMTAGALSSMIQKPTSAPSAPSATPKPMANIAKPTVAPLQTASAIKDVSGVNITNPLMGAAGQTLSYN